MTVAKTRTTAPAATWSDEEHLKFEMNNSWQYEVEHFFAAIRRQTPVTVGTSQDALKLMRLVDRIYENR